MPPYSRLAARSRSHAGCALIIPQNFPRRRLSRLALRVSVNFAETLRSGVSVRLRRTRPCAYGSVDQYQFTPRRGTASPVPFLFPRTGGKHQRAGATPLTHTRLTDRNISASRTSRTIRTIRTMGRVTITDAYLQTATKRDELPEFAPICGSRPTCERGPNHACPTRLTRPTGLTRRQVRDRTLACAPVLPQTTAVRPPPPLRRRSFAKPLT